MSQLPRFDLFHNNTRKEFIKPVQLRRQHDEPSSEILLSRKQPDQNELKTKHEKSVKLQLIRTKLLAQDAVLVQEGVEEFKEYVTGLQSNNHGHMSSFFFIIFVDKTIAHIYLDSILKLDIIPLLFRHLQNTDRRTAEEILFSIAWLSLNNHNLPISHPILVKLDTAGHKLLSYRDEHRLILGWANSHEVFTIRTLVCHALVIFSNSLN